MLWTNEDKDATCSAQLVIRTASPRTWCPERGKEATSLGKRSKAIQRAGPKVCPKICDLNVQNEGENGVNAVKKNETVLKKCKIGTARLPSLIFCENSLWQISDLLSLKFLIHNIGESHIWVYCATDCFMWTLRSKIIRQNFWYWNVKNAQLLTRVSCLPQSNKYIYYLIIIYYKYFM